MIRRVLSASLASFWAVSILGASLPAAETEIRVLKEPERLDLMKALFPEAKVSMDVNRQFGVKAKDGKSERVDLSTPALAFTLNGVEYLVAVVRFVGEEQRVRYAIRDRKEWRRENHSFLAIVSEGFDGPYVIRRTLAEDNEAYWEGFGLDVRDFFHMGKPQIKIGYDSRAFVGNKDLARDVIIFFDLPDGRMFAKFLLATGSSADPEVYVLRQYDIVNVDDRGPWEIVLVDPMGKKADQVLRLEGGVFRPWKDAPSRKAWPKHKRRIAEPPAKYEKVITLHGTVTDTGGNPLDNAIVFATGASARAREEGRKEAQRGARTNEKGAFVIEIECDQAMSIWAYAKGHVKKTLAFAEKKGEAGTIRPDEPIKIVLEKAEE